MRAVLVSSSNICKVILILCCYLSITSPAFAGLFSYDDFDECILGSMKGVKSDDAAYLIEESCRKKFPEPKPDKNCVVLKRANGDVFPQLDGMWGTFGLQIYNGHETKTVAEVIANVTCGEEKVSRRYKIKVSTKPLTKTSSSNGPGKKEVCYEKKINYYFDTIKLCDPVK